MSKAHQRVISVSTVHNDVHLTRGVDEIQISASLKELRDGLARPHPRSPTDRLQCARDLKCHPVLE
ncbi:hypothetical protein J5N58_25550 [Rhizobium cremeum]|uniref:hypothetical protein n=1 Tax=Rhizobiaceae TaxID=82115 RepID=UPI003CC7E2FE|nr:hypothetical protein [Rhizobium cremeum]MCJ8003051.1 hypothetical protein [Rhizobium cremeum]